MYNIYVQYLCKSQSCNTQQIETPNTQVFCNYVIKLRTHTKKKKKYGVINAATTAAEKTATVGKSSRRMRNHEIASSRMYKDKRLCR